MRRVRGEKWKLNWLCILGESRLEVVGRAELKLRWSLKITLHETCSSTAAKLNCTANPAKERRCPERGGARRDDLRHSDTAGSVCDCCGSLERAESILTQIPTMQHYMMNRAGYRAIKRASRLHDIGMLHATARLSPLNFIGGRIHPHQRLLAYLGINVHASWR